jgi:hypothetical protein
MDEIKEMAEKQAAQVSGAMAPEMPTGPSTAPPTPPERSVFIRQVDGGFIMSGPDFRDTVCRTAGELAEKVAATFDPGLAKRNAEQNAQFKKLADEIDAQLRKHAVPKFRYPFGGLIY